jgi:hypothetical protein
MIALLKLACLVAMAFDANPYPWYVWTMLILF